jgi:type IV secretory pathway TrbD component
LARRRPSENTKTKERGLKVLIRKTLEETGASLGAGRFVLINLGLAAIQVGLVVGCFLSLLPTVGIELDPHMPVLAVSGVIAFGALSAIILPPSLGAGPATAAVFVYGLFGVTQDQALAFAAMSWIANTAPVLFLGLIPLLRRIRRFGSLKAFTQVGEPDP